jgi:segregation and condensation protein B
MPEPSVDQDLLTRVSEALIFAADEPLTAATIADVYAEVTGDESLDTDDVDAVVDGLNLGYQAAGSTIRIERWAGGFRMATVPELAPFVKALLASEEDRRLSRSLMETLAVIAYKQPVTKPEIDFVRGVNADYALRKLLETRLVAVVGRDESVGRPLLYGTTGEFLEQFGLSGLADLPRPREIDELLEDPAFTRERAELMASLDPDQRQPGPAGAPEEHSETNGQAPE